MTENFKCNIYSSNAVYSSNATSLTYNALVYV